MQRKSSNETLATIGMDSTLDSRMSSAEIPQMELLKVNYVHQCKEALMPRQPTQRTPQMSTAAGHVSANVNANSSGNVKSSIFKRASTGNSNSSHSNRSPLANVSKVMLGAEPPNRRIPASGKLKQHPPPPPPTVESWHFLQQHQRQPAPQQQQQQERHSVGAIKFRDLPKCSVDCADLERGCDDGTSCCNSACSSLSASDDDDGDASTISPDCEKSHSWNYRAKVSTCDIRRDLARAGIKSRADRIARIEQSDCDHRRVPNGPAQRASLPAVAAASAQPTEVVTQINKMFEQATSEQRRSLKLHRAPSPPTSAQPSAAHPLKLPPQPRRPAPLPVKEPNMRHRASMGAISLASDERVKRLGVGAAKRCDCTAPNAAEPNGIRSSSFGGRFRASPATLNEGKQPISRIPKPIGCNDAHRLSTSSAYLFNEANEQLQRRIKQMFEQEQDRRQQPQSQSQLQSQLQPQSKPHIQAQSKLQSSPTHSPNAVVKTKLRATKSTAFEDKIEPQLRKSRAGSCDDLGSQFLKHTRQHMAGNYQKMKLERVHIRKKRQPLLIINQLNESKSTNNKANIEESTKLHEKQTDEMEQQKLHESTNGSKRTCGYKNCNYTNCPMSTKEVNSSASHESDEEANQRKRLSLESCSDSGVSSSNDVKEQTKENNLKNLEKCADCVKILLSQNSTEVVLPLRYDNGNHTYRKLQLSPQTAAHAQKLKELSNTSEGQIKIQVGKPPSADPNDVQNFAKKNVTKATTDELLTAAIKNNNNSNSLSMASISGSKATTKQCNIENDLKNNEQRKYNNTNARNSTTIKIDDDWVQESQDTPLYVDELLADADTLQQAPRKSPNHAASCNERGDNKNSVKIFVRSSNAASGAGNTSRASSVSVSSYASQTSGCSTNSNSSAATNISKTSMSCDSFTGSSGSGSGGRSSSSAISTECSSIQCNCHAMEDLEHSAEGDNDYYCSLGRMTASGMFFNRASHDLERMQSDTLRARASSPAMSTGAYSKVSCVTCNGSEDGDNNAAAKRNSTLNGDGAFGGVFWNNSYFQQDIDLTAPNSTAEASAHPIVRVKQRGCCNHNVDADADADTDIENQCCCSLTSCDDDNCSYYDGDGGNRCMASVIEVRASIHSPNGDNKINNNNKSCNDANNDEVEREHERERERYMLQQQQIQRQRIRERERQLQLLRNSSIEEILIRNKKLLRKADVIHELRPRSMDGVIDSSSASLNGDNTGSSLESGDHIQNQQDSEARRIHRGHVLTELLETERIYVNEMASILKGYRDQMLSEEMMHLVPASLQGKEDILFGNLHELYTFHNDIFLKDLENCISTTELVALCFVQRRDTFYRLYSFYCQNIPRSERLRETLVDTHLFLQECQKRLGHKLPLGAYLLKPVQRITKYKLLLENLLGSSDSGSCTKELQKALDCMLIVLRCVNDSMHQVAITGFPSNLSQQGELLLQDPFQVWTESKKDIRLRIKPQQRHIFLYQKSMILCKKTSKPGHNKSTYQFKHQLKMSQIGLTESVRGDSKRFEVWLQGRQEVHTLQAPSDEVKNKWVAEIKRVLLNQLEELKGEKIKQYGMNHHGLRQTTSWDTPNILLGMQQRAVSCDASSESSNRNSNCSSSGDDAYPGMPPMSSGIGSSSAGSGSSGGTSHGNGNSNGISGCGTSASGDKEQQEACGWSSDYSNSDDEMSLIEDNSAPGSKFVALADYAAMGHSEVSMREGDTVELLKVGCAGWWFVRVLEANAEGWTPAAYMEPLNRKSSRSSSRNQERINFNKFAE